jgi:hypothetical protein
MSPTVDCEWPSRSALLASTLQMIMNNRICAFTSADPILPPYFNVERDRDEVIITDRRRRLSALKSSPVGGVASPGNNYCNPDPSKPTGDQFEGCDIPMSA